MNRCSTITPFALTVWVGLLGTLSSGSLRGEQAPVDIGPLTQPGQAVVIRGGWLFDGIEDVRVQNEGILIRGGKFLDVNGGLDDYDVQGALVIILDDDQTGCLTSMPITGSGSARTTERKPDGFPCSISRTASHPHSPPASSIRRE